MIRYQVASFLATIMFAVAIVSGAWLMSARTTFAYHYLYQNSIKEGNEQQVSLFEAELNYDRMLRSTKPFSNQEIGLASYPITEEACRVLQTLRTVNEYMVIALSGSLVIGAICGIVLRKRRRYQCLYLAPAVVLSMTGIGAVLFGGAHRIVASVDYWYEILWYGNIQMLLPNESPVIYSMLPKALGKGQIGIAVLTELVLCLAFVGLYLITARKARPHKFE